MFWQMEFITGNVSVSTVLKEDDPVFFPEILLAFLVLLWLDVALTFFERRSHLLAIRLTRKGSKKKPFYRVVVVEKSAPRDGRSLEVLGYYNPIPEPTEFQLNLERVQYWMSKGAQPSDTVRRLVTKATAASASTSSN